MGAKCCAESKQVGSPTEVPAEVKDLPAIDLSGIKDPYEKFEASLPFNRTLVTQLIAKVEEAEKELGDNGYVTLEKMSEKFPTTAWAGLKDPNSMLGKALLSKAFKDPSKEQTAE